MYEEWRNFLFRGHLLLELISLAQSPDRRPEGFLEEAVPWVEAAEFQAILEMELITAELRRYAVAI